MEANICGLNIRKKRREMGMAQVELAAALSVDHELYFTQSDISEIERLARGVKDFELKAIAQILEVTCDELFK